MGVAGPVVRRMLYLALLSVLLFYAIHAMPGGALGAYRALDADLPDAEIERLMRLEGLDRPIYAQYRCWLLGGGATGCGRWPSDGVLRGDLGHSRVFLRPVADLLAERLTRTLRLMVPAVALALIGSLLLGTWAARRAGRWPDRLISAATFIGQSTPLHWAALMAILVGAVYIGALPPGGVAPVDDRRWAQYAYHAVLPVGCLAAYYGAFWTRYLRLELLSVAARPFVTAARAKGLPEGAVWRRHVLPNALIPMLTSVSLALPSVFSGVLVIEKVFSYPGVGLLMYDSVRLQDHLTAMVVFLIYAGLAMAATTLADLMVRWLNPAAEVQRR